MSAAYDELMAWHRNFYAEILLAPELEPIRHLYPDKPETLNDHKKYYWAHNRAMWAMIQNLSEKAIDITVRGIDDFVRHRLKVPAAGLSKGGKIEETVNEFKMRSHAALPVINRDKIAEMSAYFETQDCFPGNYKPNPTLYSLEDARKDRPYIAHYPLQSVMECPNLLAIANHPTIISSAAHYLGTIPTILGYSAWWSFSQREAPEEAQLFHFDLGDYRFCTLMLYLSDVDEDAGPHMLIEGSHDLNAIRSIQQKHSDHQDEFDQWYFHQHRKTDEEVQRYIQQYLGQDSVTLTGPAGTALMLCPRAIHKGLMPTKTDRLVCQVNYGCTPQLQTELRPMQWDTPATTHLPKWLKAEPFRYINRLFLETG